MVVECYLQIHERTIPRIIIVGHMIAPGSPLRRANRQIIVVFALHCAERPMSELSAIPTRSHSRYSLSWVVAKCLRIALASGMNLLNAETQEQTSANEEAVMCSETIANRAKSFHVEGRHSVLFKTGSPSAFSAAEPA